MTNSFKGDKQQKTDCFKKRMSTINSLNILQIIMHFALTKNVLMDSFIRYKKAYNTVDSVYSEND